MENRTHVQKAEEALEVFDCNASFGRRHNERAPFRSKDAFLAFMARAQISRALIYNPYSIHWGTMEGNRLLLDAIGETKCLIPQFVVSFAVDDIDEVQELTREAAVRSIRIFPNSHRYPLVPWISDPWLEWVSHSRIALWIPMGYSPEADVRDLYEIAGRFPTVSMVLAGSHYMNYSSIWPLLKVRENIYFDLSRFDSADGVQRLIRHVGVHRLLFGSALPDVDPMPYLYYLRHSGLTQPELEDICHRNLERILGSEPGS
jgi:hypothetical protein